MLSTKKAKETCKKSWNSQFNSYCSSVVLKLQSRLVPSVAGETSDGDGVLVWVV